MELALDIETTGLAYTDSRITTWALADDEWGIVRESDDEAWLIGELRRTLERLSPVVILTWNGAVFDIPFIIGRGRLLGLDQSWIVADADPNIIPKYEPQPGFPAMGISAILCGHPTLDVAYEVREQVEAAGVKWALKPVARAAGIDVIEVDRTKMDALTPEERQAYCLSDVRATYLIHERWCEGRLGRLKPAV